MSVYNAQCRIERVYLTLSLQALDAFLEFQLEAFTNLFQELDRPVTTDGLH